MLLITWEVLSSDPTSEASSHQLSSDKGACWSMKTSVKDALMWPRSWLLRASIRNFAHPCSIKDVGETPSFIQPSHLYAAVLKGRGFFTLSIASRCKQIASSEIYPPCTPWTGCDVPILMSKYWSVMLAECWLMLGAWPIRSKLVMEQWMDQWIWLEQIWWVRFFVNSLYPLISVLHLISE